MIKSGEFFALNVKPGERQYGRIVPAFGGHPWLTPVPEEKAQDGLPKYKESAMLKEG